MTHAAFPDSGWRAYQSSCPLLSPERGAVGSWRKAGDPGPAGVKAVAALSSGQKSAPAVPLPLRRPSLTGNSLVKTLPRPLLLALCPKAVGGAPVSLVGRQDRHAPPFQPSPPYHSLGDRCIVFGKRRQLDGAPRPPSSPSTPFLHPGRRSRSPASPPCIAMRPWLGRRAP